MAEPYLLLDEFTGGDRDQAVTGWHALYTRPRAEKRVCEQLQQKQIDAFLPLYRAERRWKNGRAIVELPLFPGYVFVNLVMEERVRVLRTMGAVRFVGFGAGPALLPESDIVALQNAIQHKLHVEPIPYIRVGQSVLVARGPLSGLQGILIRKKQDFRVVISLHMLLRSVVIDVDAGDVEPLS